MKPSGLSNQEKNHLETTILNGKHKHDRKTAHDLNFKDKERE